MTRTLLAAAAATLLVAAPAFARDAERSFTHEGVSYVYTATPQGEATVLEGTASQGGTFRFVVKNGWVDGYAGNSRVSFRAPKRRAGILVAQR